MILDNELYKLLLQSPKKDGKHTHTIPGKGAYFIEKENLDMFYKLVHKEFFINNKRFMFVEKIQDTCTLVIDLDMKYKDKYEVRQYTKETIDELLQFFFEKLQKLFHLKDNHYQVWLFEKPSIRKCDKAGYQTKDGVHLTFPNIKASKELYQHLVELVYEDKELFDEILEKTCINIPSNSITDIVDKTIYGTNWLLYGSCKMEEVDSNVRYELTRIININQSGDIVDVPIDIYLNRPLAIIQKNSVYECEKSVEYTEYSEQILKNNNKNLNNSTEEVIVPTFMTDTEIEPANIITLKSEEFKLIKRLVDKLDPVRADNYGENGSWRDVGFVLNNFSKSKEMLDIWIDFSKKSTKYTNSDAEKSCKDAWKSWYSIQKKENHMTIRSLHWWVKQDIGEPEYRELLKDSLAGRVEQSLNHDGGAHYDVAMVISDYYKNEFVCSGLKENYWYYFNEEAGGKWEKTEIGHKLRKRLSDEIVDIYFYYGQKFQDIAKALPEGAKKKIWNTLVANCGKIIANLKNSTYKDKIIRECRELFYDPEFDEKINSKLNLIGFDNGVFDLSTMTFRMGAPDDFVTVTTKYSLPVTTLKEPIPFQNLYDIIMNDKKNKVFVKELNEFIKQVLPNRVDGEGNRTDDRLRNYVLRFLSSCLSGEVREEKFYFWTGSGGNGKSKLIELLDFTLGEYSKTLDVAYFTNKRGSSSSASPEVETLKHARFVSCSEPDEDDKIYVGKLKQITGGDKLTSRGLYKETTEFKPQFKIALMCNELPKLHNQDGGTWRRIEVVEFISRFNDNPMPTQDDPNQFIADINLSGKLKEWNIVFMMILLDKFREYTEMGTKPPEEVKEGTEKYKETSDIITNWFNSELTICDYENGKAPTHMDILYDWFKDWCSNEGINKKEIPIKKKVRDTLIKKQEKCKHGATWGRNKINGTKNSPLFTFKLIT